MKFPDMKKPLLHYDLSDVLAVVNLLIVYAFAGILVSVVLHLAVPTDDSDKSRFVRSGMQVLTDHKTGVEYLKTPEGFLVRRDGK